MRKKALPVLVACISILSTVPVPAATRTFSTGVGNTVMTGDIGISLHEFELDLGGRRIPYRNGKTVVPGQKVDKIVTITSEAEPAWVRARVEYNTDDGLEGMSDDMLEDMPDGWKKCGSYFYYTEPVAGMETIDFFRRVVIPPEWDESCSEKRFSIGVTAQAVQAANFKPDFQSVDPWFGIPVEKCIHTSHDIYHAENKSEFSVIFENGTEGFTKTGDDFFSNFSAMMPGDTLTDTMELGNHSGYVLTFYFSTEIPEQPGESRKLLDDLLLTIRCGEESIYEGSLGAEKLKEGVPLGKPLGKGDTRTLSYSLHMPPELTNSSAMQTAKVRWIFRTEYRTPSGSSSGGGTSPGSGSGGRTYAFDPSPVPQTRPEIPGIPDLVEDITGWILPKTGDLSKSGLYLLVFIASGTACVVLLSAGRKKRRRKEARNGQP